TANLKAFNIGGSGAVFIVKGSGAGGQISDGTNDCTFTTAAILKKLFGPSPGQTVTGAFFKPDCTTVLNELNNATGAGGDTHPTGVAGDVQMFTRSDLPSGTAETAAGWVFQSPSSKDFSTGTAAGAIGNPWRTGSSRRRNIPGNRLRRHRI